MTKTSIANGRALAELVRLPSLLSVPGDALLGASAAADGAGVARAARLTGASGLLYMSGMALNDYADREIDAAERPQRPIPSGRIDARFAVRLSAALSLAGVGVAAAAGGRKAVAVALPLAGTVWAYDLAVKRTRAGPAAMALARSLDVLLGASRGETKRALPAAALVGAHTALVTLVSRREVEGGTTTLAHGAIAGTGAVTAGALAFIAKRLHADRGRERGPVRLARLSGGLALAAAYASSLARAELAAARDPTPRNFQRIVGKGVLGLMPLEASLLAAAGPPWAASGVAAAWPVARRLAARTPVT